MYSRNDVYVEKSDTTRARISSVRASCGIDANGLFLTLEMCVYACVPQVDGGINAETVRSCAEAGADVVVAGSAVYKSDTPSEMCARLKKAVQAAIDARARHTS